MTQAWLSREREGGTQSMANPAPACSVPAHGDRACCPRAHCCRPCRTAVHDGAGLGEGVHHATYLRPALLVACLAATSAWCRPTGAYDTSPPSPRCSCGACSWRSLPRPARKCAGVAGALAQALDTRDALTHPVRPGSARSPPRPRAPCGIRASRKAGPAPSGAAPSGGGFVTALAFCEWARRLGCPGAPAARS